MPLRIEIHQKNVGILPKRTSRQNIFQIEIVIQLWDENCVQFYFYGNVTGIEIVVVALSLDLASTLKCADKLMTISMRTFWAAEMKIDDNEPTTCRSMIDGFDGDMLWERRWSTYWLLSWGNDNGENRRTHSLKIWNEMSHTNHGESASIEGGSKRCASHFTANSCHYYRLRWVQFIRANSAWIDWSNTIPSVRKLHIRLISIGSKCLLF